MPDTPVLQVTKTRPGFTTSAAHVYAMDICGGHAPTCPKCGREQLFISTRRGHRTGNPCYYVYRLCPMQAVKVCPVTKKKIRFYLCAPPGTLGFPRLEFNVTIFYAMAVTVQHHVANHSDGIIIDHSY
jgi:hypothetical protein